MRSVADGNIGSIMGTGAPALTGGYLHFVNTYDLEEFINRCDELADLYGESFRVPALVSNKLSNAELFT